MTADIHTCSYQCQRPACVLAQRDELVRRAEADAAEIVRLRGEAESMEQMARMQAARADAAEREVTHLRSIASAEAKTPAPAMPIARNWCLAWGEWAHDADPGCAKENAAEAALRAALTQALAQQPPAEAQDKWKALIGKWQQRAEAAGYDGIEGALEAAEAQAQGGGEVVAWQHRMKFRDGRWSGWAQSPSEEEAAWQVDSYKEHGIEAEYRRLYAEPQPAPPAQGFDADVVDRALEYLRPHLEAGTFAAPYWAIQLASILTGGDGCGKPVPTSAPVGVESEPGAVRSLVAAANAVLALYPGDDQLWTLESAVRPFNAKKPAECVDGCPPQQVCDYCQIAAIAQQPAACPKCDGTGEADSGGIHPWGAPATIPCDCQQPAMLNGVEAARVLADFAETAPGRLPGRVQDAIATVRAADNRDAARVWRPIETAPKDNARPLYLARFNPDTGELQGIDWDGSWEAESEGWEMPQIYYVWKSAHATVDEPTHWAYQDEPIPPTSSAVPAGEADDAAPSPQSAGGELPHGFVAVDSAALLAVHSALSRSIGDTDPYVAPDATDEEVHDELPVFWAAQQIAFMLAAAPTPQQPVSDDAAPTPQKGVSDG